MNTPDFRGSIVRNTAEDHKYLAGYLLEDIVGQGGQATVYRAVDLSEPSNIDRTVAVKLCQPFEDEQQQQAFQTEGHRTSKWQHPNILPTFAYGLGAVEGNPIQAEYPMIVMPHVEEGSLASYMTKVGRVPLQEAVDLTWQASRGLQYAHDRRTLHRDIKPANFLLGRDEQGKRQVKVSDFGIAANLHEIGSVSITPQTRAGTLAYVSPEQLDGKAIRQSDIYSMAVVAYELAIGKRPFPGDTAAGLMRAHLYGTPAPFEQAGVPMDKSLEAIEPVVMRSLAKNPRDRHASMGDFGEDYKTAYSQGQAKEAKATVTIDLGNARNSTEPVIRNTSATSGPNGTKIVPHRQAQRQTRNAQTPPVPNRPRPRLSARQRRRNDFLEQASCGSFTIGFLGVMIPIADNITGDEPIHDSSTHAWLTGVGAPLTILGILGISYAWRRSKRR